MVQSTKDLYEELIKQYVEGRIRNVENDCKSLCQSGKFICFVNREHIIGDHDYMYVTVVYYDEQHKIQRDFSFETSLFYEHDNIYKWIIEMTDKCIKNILSELKRII